MIEDLRNLPDGSALTCDVCVVGAGVAGLSFVRELLSSRLDVVLLESGGGGGPEGTDVLNEGASVGVPYTALALGRTRGLGGTSELYGGQCTPMDPADFAPRPWVPWSGWPFDRDALEPYYRRAHRVFELPETTFDPGRAPPSSLDALGLDPARLVPHVSVFSPKRYLGRNLRSALEAAPQVRVLLHATVTQLDVDEAGGRVVAAEVRSLGGKRAAVRARAFVLCCGAIENARLLLLSNRRRETGLGNARGLVGRFLQDHVLATGGTVRTRRWVDLYRQWQLVRVGDLRYARKLRLSEPIQASEGLLNATVSVVFDYDDGQAAEAMVRLYRALLHRRWRDLRAQDLAHLVSHPLNVLAFGARHLGYTAPAVIRPQTIRLSCISEQAPHPDSRVSLSTDRDPFGLPKARVDWRLTDLERRSLGAVARVAQAEFARIRWAEVRVAPWLGDPGSRWTDHVRDILHTSGTTRMASDPARGVVDADGKVFDVGNLYVCGSSVFPTGGHANPVLTIAALAVRLADHLKRALLHG